MNQEIGRVRKIDEIKGIDGRWYVALATVTQRPAWLRREELRRRIAWCEATYGRVDVEMVLRGMRLEKNGPSLDELVREHRVTTAA